MRKKFNNNIKFLFKILILFQSIVLCLSDDKYKIVSNGWLTIDSKKANDLPLQNDFNNGDYFIYDQKYENNEPLKFNENFINSNIMSDLSLTFNYWSKDELKWHLDDDKDKKEVFHLNSNEKFGNSEIDIKLTHEQWKKIQLDNSGSNTRMSIKDVNVEYRQKINLPIHQERENNFQNLHDGFIFNSTKKIFIYKTIDKPATLQYLTNNNEDFLKKCIKITKVSEFNPKLWNISITFEHEIFAVELPRDVDFYNSGDGFCLGNFFALQPNGRTMITINVKPDQSDFTVEFNDKNQPFSPQHRKYIIYNNEWIYNHPLLNKNIMLEDGKSDAKIYACDIMANCFKYNNNGKTLKLNYFDENVLKKSPFIKIINFKSISQFFFENSSSNIIEMLKNKPVFIDDNMKFKIKDFKDEISFSIPYIDIRNYPDASLMSDTSDIKNINVIIKNKGEVIGEIELNDYDLKSKKLALNNFFYPRKSDLFENYQLEFELTKKDSLTTGSTIQDFIPKTDWNYKNYRSINSDVVIEIKNDTEFNCEETQLKFKIIFYNGKIEDLNFDCKDFKDNAITIKNVIITGPYKIFYSSDKAIEFDKIKLNNEVQKLIIPTSPRYLWFDGTTSSQDDCPANFRYDSNITRCVLNTIYRTKNVNCAEDGCSNIFNKKLLKINFYYDNFGQIIFNDNPVFGHKTIYIPNKNQSIQIKNNDEKNLCIKFKYFGNGKRLYINHHKKEIDTLYPPIWFNSKKSDNNDEIFESYNTIDRYLCMSDLSPNRINSLSIWFDNFDKLQYISDIVVDENSWPNPLDSLNINEINNNYFIPFDNEEISIIENKSLTVSFSSKDHDIDDDNYTIILTSKFIKLQKLKDQYYIDLGLKNLHNDWTDNDNDNIFIEFRPPSNNTKSSYSIKELKNNQINRLIYDNQKSNGEFQLQFRFQINNFTNRTKESDFQLKFSIDSITLYDPCVNDNIESNYCHNKEGSGICTRYFIPEPFRKCQCQYYASGEDCERIDYCLRHHGSEYCLKHNLGYCVSSTNDYQCTCLSGQIWIPQMKWCLTSSNIKCKANERISYDDVTLEPKCVCNENFVRVNDSCVEYDICDPKHRLLKKEYQVNPCDDNLAKCEPFFDKKNEKQYHCVCPNDLYNVEGKFDRNAKCSNRVCDLNLMCEQKCLFNHYNGQHKCECFELYHPIDNGKCEIDPSLKDNLDRCLPPNHDILNEMNTPYTDTVGNCLCKYGYQYNQMTKICEANENDDFHKKIGCESFKLNDDNQLICKCAKGKYFDEHYGKCRWNACPSGMIKYSIDPNDIGNFDCISPCDEKLIKTCSSNGPFYSCKPEKVIESLKKRNYLNWNIDEPFVEGKHLKANNVNDYCQCIFGYKFDENENRCKQDTNFEFYTLKMEVVKNFNKFTTEKYVREILSDLLKSRLISAIDKITCIENSDDIYDCMINLYGLSTEKLLAKIIKELHDNCINHSKLFIDGDKNLCSFLTKKKSNIIQQLLVVKNDSMILEPYDFCRSNPCRFFPNSYCQMNNKSNDFSCECSDDFTFDKHYPTPSLNQYHACKLKSCVELNYHCDDPKATCLMLNNQNDIENRLHAKLIDNQQNTDDLSLPMPFCLCSNGYLLSNLSSTCDDHCKMECNNGECFYTMAQKREICICNDDWLGEKCDIKKSDNNHHNDDNDDDDHKHHNDDDDHKHHNDDDDKKNKKSDDDETNGYKISTIILAILSAILVVGVIFLFIRSRN